MTPTLYIDKQWCADFAQGWHVAGTSRSVVTGKPPMHAQRMTFACYFAAEMATSRAIRHA